MAVRSQRSSVPQRIPRPQGLGNGYFKPFLPPCRMCFASVARRVSLGASAWVKSLTYVQSEPNLVVLWHHIARYRRRSGKSQGGLPPKCFAEYQASIVGRRIGRLRWCAASGKTVEGSIAFFVSVVAFSSLLWMLGLVDRFEVSHVGLLRFDGLMTSRSGLI